MKMHILLTVLHIFHMELVRRICLNIETSCPWCHFFYSHHLNVEQVVMILREISFLSLLGLKGLKLLSCLEHCQ